jgi:hypothetical protein
MMREPELREPGYDLDFSDANSTAWNRASVGMLDCPSEHELTAAAVLAITSAENIALCEYVRWLSLDTDGDL